MRYRDGSEIRLGDRVQISAGSPNITGTVVCSLDTGEYSEKYPEEAWSYLQKGVLFDFESLGLVHYEQDDPDLLLIERGSG